MTDTFLTRLGWYRNRLARMSGGEMIYRVRNKMDAMLESRGIGIVKQVPAYDGQKSGACWFGRNVDIEPLPYLASADRVLAGTWDIFALKGIDLGQEPKWNRDPKSGTDAPLVFGKTLNYRDESLVGDIKYLWEPSRHLELVGICQAYRLTGNDDYRREFFRLLDSWIAACPYPLGPHWTSSLELGIRLINWSLCWQLLPVDSNGDGGNSESESRSRWLESIYRHCHFISGHLSRHSSANNHLIGEAAGLFIAALTWPGWQESQRWAAQASVVLAEECLKQNAPDGVNREQAISYQQFVLDFLIVAGLTGQANGMAFGDEYWDRICAMLEFLASVMDVAGNMPMIGDADDGYAVRISREEEFCAYRSLLATGALLFDRPGFARKAGRLDDKTRWLLGDRPYHRVATAIDNPDEIGPGWERLSSSPVILPVRTQFPDGGYWILGSDFETAHEVRCVFDAGPLGYLAIAAHGHADALSFTLSVAGREILIDPGTYAYHTERRWREYFKGTSAHNTVVVDGQDQSVSGGNFMWVRHAEAEVEEWRSDVDEDCIVAHHNGYERLANPLRHRRRLEYRKSARKLMVTDTLEATGEHHIARCWHFPEGCRVEESGGVVHATSGESQVTLSDCSDGAVTARIYQASESPVWGWVSRSFDHKIPGTTVVWESTVVGPTTLVTEINCRVGGR